MGTCSSNSDGICDYNIMFLQQLHFNDSCFHHCKRLISACVEKEGEVTSIALGLSVCIVLWMCLCNLQ